MSTHKEYALIAILAMAAVVGVIPAFAADNPYLACPDCNDTSSNIQSPPIPITVLPTLRPTPPSPPWMAVESSPASLPARPGSWPLTPRWEFPPPRPSR